MKQHKSKVSTLFIENVFKRFWHFIGQIYIGPCCIFQVYVTDKAYHGLRKIKHSFSHPTEWEISVLQGYPHIKLANRIVYIPEWIDSL